jgi:uncharacterized protein (TIGR02145 family)
MKQFFSLLTLLCATLATQAQDVYNVYCTQSITLQPDGGELGTNAEWKWYTGSCGGSLAHTGASYTITPTASATYYVRAEGSCGTTTCRSVIVNVLPPTLTVKTSALQAEEGYKITFTAEGFPAGGVYTWNAATPIGGNAATATISSTSTNGVYSATDNRPVLRATATYTVGGGSAGCRSTSNNNTILATCPYTGSDKVPGSCYQASTGAQNWRATINDARISGTATLNTTEGRKYYNIVRMPDNKWWFAENVNFQKGLTWVERADSPFTTTTNGVPGIGHFWCPGGSNSTVTTSNRAGCNLWGALYTWETTMMVDGKYSGDGITNGDWVEPTSSYCTYTTDQSLCTQNAGRGTGNHGICPSGWYIPTKSEWVNMLNIVETGEKNYGTGNGVLLGTYASSMLRSDITCPVTNAACVSDTYVGNNYYSTVRSSRNSYGLTLTMHGGREQNPPVIMGRGSTGRFLTSTPYNTTHSHSVIIYAYLDTMYNNMYNRAYGGGVRCVK